MIVLEEDCCRYSVDGFNRVVVKNIKIQLQNGR